MFAKETGMIAHDSLHDLKLRFLERCRSNIGNIKAAGDDARILERGELHAEIVRTVHSLAGAGGIFGFDALSARAIDLETYLISGHELDAGKVCGLCEALGAEMQGAIDS
ncbi:Hpt domain-containing protein [uncultured Hoeflea sp.]|uniref:Hpt domain-containing protein n=1 Tax=uncultured Hoeflea sp. TaxID=538666 RepID=UPI0030D7BE8D|tara:strand:+ start:313 stop:642 length:330 start_codon:yes stop_codon:yes gene_type:complete